MLEGTHNFRDTGGTPLSAGGTTRPGVLYRSDALSDLTPTGLAQLAATGIAVIADLRTPMERSMSPDRLPHTRHFHVVTLPLLEGAVTGIGQQAMTTATHAAGSPDGAAAAMRDALSHLPALGDLYVSMLTHGAASFAQLARLAAAIGEDPAPGVLVHCTAGKDRTGIAVALLLDAVGAERAAVVADYAASGGNLAGPWAQRMRQTVTSLGMRLTPALDVLVTATPPAAIEQALAWVDAQHGGAAGYLRSGGLGADELSALRARLTG